MIGFEGPFRFNIEDKGERISSKDLNKEIRKKLTKNEREGASVYRCKVATIAGERCLEKHHDWAKVTRLLVEALPSHKSMRILGLYPSDKKSKFSKQEEMDFAATAEGKAKLFDMLRFKLSLSHFVKNYSRQDRYEVMCSFTSKRAQWVFSSAYESLDFDLYVYIVVPDELADSERNLRMSVNPLRKGNKSISMAAIYGHQVSMPAA